MGETINRSVWVHVEPKLEEDDDPKLWRLVLADVLVDLDSEYLWQEVRTPDRIHLIIAKQSHWWRPHQAALTLGGDVNAYQPADWELHWYRDGRTSPWNFVGSSIGKTKGQTKNCFIFVPARTTSHDKTTVIQEWKPPLGRGLPPTRSKRSRDRTLGAEYRYRRDDAGAWTRIENFYPERYTTP